MSAALPFQNTCCSSCDDVTVTNVPGPAGAAGAAGATGTAGQNAYTVTSADFVIPAIDGGTVTITVGNSTWATIGQVLYIQGAGYFELTNKPSSTEMTIENIETTAGAYSANVAAGTTISAGAQITPGGLQGYDASFSGTAAGGDLAGTYPNPTLGIMTANGDLVTRIAGVASRYALGAEDYVLHSDGTGIVWRQIDCSGGNTSLGIAPLPVSRGGTNKTGNVLANTTTALDNLLPSGKTAGDIFYWDTTALRRLPATTNGYYLKLSGGVPVWDEVTATAAVSRSFFAALAANQALSSTPATLLFSITSGNCYESNAGSVATGMWTPGSISKVSLAATLRFVGSGASAVTVNFYIYKVVGGTDTVVAQSTDTFTPASTYKTYCLSATSFTSGVTEKFKVVASASPTGEAQGSTTEAYCTFSGFTLP